MNLQIFISMNTSKLFTESEGSLRVKKKRGGRGEERSWEFLKKMHIHFNDNEYANISYQITSQTLFCLSKRWNFFLEFLI